MHKSNLSQPSDTDQVVCLDGALGTELEKLGFDIKHELWSAHILQKDPKAIQAIHESYLLAGAQIITTASYQLSYASGQKSGLKTHQVDDLLTLSIALVLGAISNVDVKREEVCLAASIGPYAGLLSDGSEYHGSYDASIEILKDFHRPKWEHLLTSDVDVLAFETIPNIYEAEAIRILLEEYPEKPIWVSFCCRDHMHLSDGNPLALASNLFSDYKELFAIGVNCTDPKYISSLIQEISRSTDQQRIMVYPNAGARYDEQTRQWDGNSGEYDLPGLVHQWIKAGAKIVGGCCGIGPTEIEAIKRALP